MQKKLLDLENQGATDVQSGTAQPESCCQWARWKLFVFEVLLFLTGRLPYCILKLTSLPWCLLPCLVPRLIPCFALTSSWKKAREIPTHNFCDAVSVPNSFKDYQEVLKDRDFPSHAGNLLKMCQEVPQGVEDDVRRLVEKEIQHSDDQADTRRSLHIFSNALFWTSLGSVLNCVFLIVFLRFTSVQLTGYKVLPITYMFTFGVAALFRVLLREKYDDYSETGEWIDRQMLAAFGIYLIRRGSTSLWIYPVLSIAPAAVVLSIVRWLQKADFLVRCKQAAHEELVFDKEHCALDDDVNNYFQMAPFIVSQLLLVYGITKAFAAFMVKADPEARGTLSELHAWSIKSESEDAPPRRQEHPEKRRDDHFSSQYHPVWLDLACKST